jgi:hypothetical protein
VAPAEVIRCGRMLAFVLTDAARAVRKHCVEGRGTRVNVSLARSASWTIVEVRSCSRSWRGAYLLRKAPGTLEGQPVRASAFVIPVAVAHGAVVRVNATHEHIVATAAHGTLVRADAHKVPGTVKDRDQTDDRCRARVLPAVPRLTLMRMAPAVLPLCEGGRSGTHVAAITNQRLTCRSPSRIASSSGLRRRARSNAARASSFWPSLM